jgi:predicted AlkP superfamily phosphohydrolase/phosphomutase
MGFFGRKEKTRKRAVVVGLDGVPYSLLRDLKSKGRIPNMSSLFDSGYFDRMSVSIPEISSVSWSSFMTGTQAGEHGIFGFIDFEPGTYKMYFPNFKALRAPAIWDELGGEGKRSIVINMPATYPAREINGVLISGFVAVDINKAVYPISLIPKIKEMGYRIDLDTTKAREDHEFLFRDLDETLDRRRKAVDFLWQNEDWDLFIVVVTGTDRLMHFLWDAYEDASHVRHRAFMDYFGKVDRFVGRLYERFLNLKGSRENQNQFLMLSDHGFTKINTDVYLNTWLSENGYLKLLGEKPKSIMEIGPGTKAFALDPSRVHINLKEKYPNGAVYRADYERVREEIKKGLEELSHNGNLIAKVVYLKEELYKGPYMDQAPDLVILSHHGYDLKGRVNSSRVFERTSLTGMHTQDDAFFFCSNGVGCSSIFEAKKIILDLLNS